ncbi:MAG: glycine cleavage system aminomethyltransferase GcvT [Planctomycetota bacterium]|jgi:aminomethyltransferase
MEQPRKTVFHYKHLEHGAKIVDFAGWEMPMQYAKGIVHEHLATRNAAGLFDVSHMGRFVFRGDCLPFLQYVLSNNAAALDVGQSQYTFIPNNDGGTIDDTYLYRFIEDEYLLVVNAANREKDWIHFESMRKNFGRVEVFDQTEEIVMLSLQGPQSEQILIELIDSGSLPEPLRNRLSSVTINSKKVLIARTGYTGEPVCFELFINAADGTYIWDLLIGQGAEPVGLGARDTLRLEAGLPLYGHELGSEPCGREIPIFACKLAKFAVNFSPLKKDFIGKDALSRQFEALKKIKEGDYSLIEDLPKMIRPIAVIGKGIARAGCSVFKEGKNVGYITSGTMVPYWKTKEQETSVRAICLALIDSNLCEQDGVEIEIRNKKIPAVIVARNLKIQGPYAQAVLY